MILFCAAVKEVFLLYAFWFGAGFFAVFECGKSLCGMFWLLLWPVREDALCIL